MKPAHAARGAALAETALVLTATLAMFFGIIQIGIVGYLQIMVDGAAFVAAHEYALGNVTSYVALTQRPFPLTGTPYIDQNAPDDTSVPVNYNTNLTTQRHGGVSLVRSSHLQATEVTNAPGGLLGVGLAALSRVAIHGSAIEPDNLVSNSVYDVDANGYAGASSQADYLSNVQNAPANYISMQQMAYCNAKPPFGAACPSANVAVLALGSAQFLDHDNWNRANLGVGTYAGGYTFAEMLCHQQKYAWAATAVFKPAQSIGQLPKVDTTDRSGPVGQIYSWDYLTSLGGGYTYNEKVYGATPLHPSNYC